MQDQDFLLNLSNFGQKINRSLKSAIKYRFKTPVDLNFFLYNGILTIVLQRTVS